MRRRTLTILPGTGLGFLLALASLSAHDPITTRVTWTREISRIVRARCLSCHSPGGRGPMSLVSYEDARPWAKAIREEVLTRRMPKWHAARGYGDFANDPSLSPFEIALIVAWADGGAPKGTETGTPDTGVETDRKAQSLPTGARELTVGCGEQTLPEGRLLAVRPSLGRGGSLGIGLALPDGTREIVAWIRGFDPKFAETYWLRTSLGLPQGTRLVTSMTDKTVPIGDEAAPCAVTIIVAPHQ